MLNKTQLKTMLTLQDKMNKAVDENWIALNRGWTRAAMMEAVELIEHFGQYKWWKHMEKDVPQAQMELVDIWHFALSAVLVEFNGDIEKSAEKVALQLSNSDSKVTFDGIEYDFNVLPFLEKMDLMVGLAAAKRFSVPLFVSVMAECELSTEELFRQYCSKNLLNIFRQNNGYKSGTYVKVWDGREDNEHLVEILNTLDTNDASFSDTLYQALDSRYKSLTDHA